MNLFKIILVLATIITTTLVASENDNSSTKKPEENKTDLTTIRKTDEAKTELSISPAALSKRAIASYGNHGYNNNNPSYGYNKYESSRKEPRSRKNKSRNRKSRQKNKKSRRFNKIGKGREVFGIMDNITPQLKIQNTKPIININFDSIYPNNNDQISNVKNHIVENAHSNDMKPQQEEKGKSRPGTNPSKVDDSMTEMQNKKYGNNNMTTQLKQQNLKTDTKKFVAENNLLVPKNININNGSKLPETQNNDSKVLNEENIKSMKKQEHSIVAEVQSQKPDLHDLKLFDLEHRKIEVKSNITYLGDANVVPTLSSMPAPDLNKSELETKITDAEIKKLETKSDFELKIKQSDVDLKQTLPVNLQKQSVPRTTKLLSKNTELDIKTDNSKNFNTNPKNTNFEFEKNSKPITNDKEYQPFPTKTEGKKNGKRENNIPELHVNKATSTEDIKTEVKFDAKDSKSFDGSAKPVKRSFASVDIKKETSPEFKQYESENRKLNNEGTTKGPEYTSIDLEYLLSELGIKASEPDIEKVGVETKPTPETNKLEIAKLKPDFKILKPTESIHKSSSQENFRSQETRSTQIKSKSKQRKEQPDIKGFEIKKHQLLRQAEIEKVEPKHIYKSNKTKPEQKVNGAEYVKIISDKKSEIKISKLIPTQKPQPKRSIFDPKYKIVDAGSSRYDSKETIIDYKKSNPETKYYEAKNPRPLSEQNRPKYEKPEKKIKNASPVLKESEPDYHEVSLEFENSKPGQKKIEARRDQRQSKSENRELKLKNPISTPITRAEPKSRNIPPRTRPDNPKYKNPILRKSQSTLVDYETSTKQSEKNVPEYINRESKYSISQPKNQRSENRYKKSPFLSVSQQRKDRPQDKDQHKYDGKYEGAPKPEYINIENIPRKFKTNFQDSKTTVNDRVVEIKNPIPEFRRNDPKHRSSERESVPYEPKHREVKPGPRKVVSDYEKPDYQIRESVNRKPRYEKYRPEIRRTDDAFLKDGPTYAFKNKEDARVKVYSNGAREEKKTIFKRKYRSDNKKDEPQHNESKIEYKISESKEENSQIEFKKSEPEDRQSSTEKFQSESTTLLSEHSITGPDEKDESSTPKQNFFYKAIKDWW